MWFLVPAIVGHAIVFTADFIFYVRGIRNSEVEVQI
jgi:hypothetical protein